MPADSEPDAAAGDAVRGVLRGASWAGRLRQRQVTARRFVPLDDATAFSGFRSCAV